MARTKVVSGPNGQETIELTKEENDARDAEEKAWADGANDRAFEELRRKRNQLLNNTDWWASTDLSISEAQTNYRQALRDLPATADPANPTWPEAPE
jgi:hypothetical protein